MTVYRKVLSNQDAGEIISHAREGTGLSRARQLIFWLVLVVIVALMIEIVAMATLRLLPFPAGLFWNSDMATVRASWSINSSPVDEEFGWPTPGLATTAPRDESGAKLNSEFPDASKACISAYGNSFVWGDDVPLADGWIEQLSRELKCRVSNFGVSYYGMDQAYLRFRRMIDDHAPVALLGIFPDDMMRNVNQYRGFLGAEPQPVFVKGRYVLDHSGRLQWIKRPQLDANSYLEMHRNPASILPHEYLLPDTRDGPITVRFPYTLAILRLIVSPRIRNRVRDQTPYSDFYSIDHPSEALPISIAIADAFVREAHQRGKQSFIIMMPGAGSFRMAMRKGVPDYAFFVSAMRERKVDIFDPIPMLNEKLNGRSYCELYTEETKCQGHFGVAGSALVAEVVASELRRRNLVDHYDQ